MEDIQTIIDNRIWDIIAVIKAELAPTEQEPDHVILRELKKYFKDHS